MRINDVEKVTGLTQKAIRLYENKGLINVSRDKNGYRSYSPANVEELKSIKLLRSIGASLSDIKLYLCGVISTDELMDMRKAEILKESGKNSEKYFICESILNGLAINNFETTGSFTEGEEMPTQEYGAIAVGIDIGTTTISAVVYDVENKCQLEAYSVPHSSYVCSDIRFEQSVSVIMEKSQKLLFHILNSYKKIASIGISGQMHGIIYLDSDGNAISNLINWQDKRADLQINGGGSACEVIFNITKEHISTGYGVATHYCNIVNKEVPKGAVGICSIMDFFGMRICGLKKPITHTSVAASFGLFDVQRGEFKKEELSLLGIDVGFLPQVTGETAIIGECGGIPVCVAIGDNQASFLGSVGSNEDSLLVNIGTGSQISAVGKYQNVSGDIEIRPFVEGKYLICGSCLCGGFAYSMLEEFFKSYMVSCGLPEMSQYKTMNSLAKEGYEKREQGLTIDTSFLGKRSNPSHRGSILHINKQDFTPSNLILGVLKGMCNELYDLYKLFPEKRGHIVASGGIVKKNEILKTLISDIFGVSVSQNEASEEAATGVALLSAFATGKIEYKNGFSGYISYAVSE